MRRRLVFAVVALLFASLTLGMAAPAEAARAAQAEIFATNNTAIITDPADPRLTTRLIRFAREVRGIIREGGARPGGSTLLDGVFWSSDLQQTTYERSREFDVNRTDPIELRHIAEQIRKQFDQESVLTFQPLPRASARTDAIEVEIPGLDVQRLHDGLLADPVARDHLQGGSVTLDGRLILIAELPDFDLARNFVTEIGGDWAKRSVRYGDAEFV
ncbi:MAG TPA: hypothetical protein VF069_09235 [Streptosporangiaceae bacterium]